MSFRDISGIGADLQDSVGGPGLAAYGELGEVASEMGELGVTYPKRAARLSLPSRELQGFGSDAGHLGAEDVGNYSGVGALIPIGTLPDLRLGSDPIVGLPYWIWLVGVGAYMGFWSGLKIW